MTKVGEAYIDLIAKQDQLSSGLRKAESDAKNSANKIGGNFTNTLAPMLGKIGVLFGGMFAASTAIDGIKKVVSAASDLEEMVGKFNVVFAGQLPIANQFVEELQEGFSVSEREARQYLSSIQDLLVPMGMAADKAALMSGQIVKLSADLGSFNNLPTEQVMLDIQSALVGNFETMKKYGVVLNEATVKQKAFKLSSLSCIGVSLFLDCIYLVTYMKVTSTR
jgi:hypothetical protein